jgi:sulfatase modifying factor 1
MKQDVLLSVGVAFFAALILIPKLHAQPLVTIDTVTVGDAGNAADPTVMILDGTSGYGAVGYEFNIGKYEVTIGQYTTFLNSVAATDLYGLYNTSMGLNGNVAGIARSGSSGSFSYAALGSANRPIAFVSWFDAARFANWMHNGATNGASTETGAYTLNGATSGTNFARSINATWWIPSEDEWYKAAYYKGGGTDAGYWDYPTQSDDAPGNTIGGATNQANYWAEAFAVTQVDFYSSSQNYLTDAGVFSNSDSAYGTFDQAGNLQEWNEAVIAPSTPGGPGQRGLRGGDFRSGFPDEFGSTNMMSVYRQSRGPTDESNVVGFRLASVPEPSTYALLALAATGLGAHVLRRRRQ